MILKAHVRHRRQLDERDHVRAERDLVDDAHPRGVGVRRVGRQRSLLLREVLGDVKRLVVLDGVAVVGDRDGARVRERRPGRHASAHVRRGGEGGVEVDRRRDGHRVGANAHHGPVDPVRDPDHRAERRHRESGRLGAHGDLSGLDRRRLEARQLHELLILAGEDEGRIAIRVNHHPRRLCADRNLRELGESRQRRRRIVHREDRRGSGVVVGDNEARVVPGEADGRTVARTGRDGGMAALRRRRGVGQDRRRCVRLRCVQVGDGPRLGAAAPTAACGQRDERSGNSDDYRGFYAHTALPEDMKCQSVKRPRRSSISTGRATSALRTASRQTKAPTERRAGASASVSSLLHSPHHHAIGHWPQSRTFPCANRGFPWRARGASAARG